MSIRNDYTDEQWAELTDEEREGLLSNDDDGEGEEETQKTEDEIAAEEAAAEEKRQQEAAAEAKRQQEADKAKKATDEAAAAAAATAGDEGKPAGQEDGKAEGEEDKPVAARPRGVLNDVLPDDYDKRVEANDKAQDALEQRYEDGEISFAEYRKEQRKLDRETRDLDQLKFRAELSEETGRNAMIQSWEANIASFLPAHPELTKSQPRQAAFDHFLRETTGPVLEKNGQPGMVEIEKAYKLWCEEYDFTPTGQTTTTTTTGTDRKPVRVPPTLGNVPAATQSDTEDGRWANLDRLADEDPLRFEEELAKLSAADRDAYMQAS